MSNSDTDAHAQLVLAEALTLSPKERWEDSQQKSIAQFIRTQRKDGLPYPIPGLTLNFESTTEGKIRMRLDVKESPNFQSAVKKNREVLERWRCQLTHFERRSRWESLPHPAQILIARSKMGLACLDWMKSSDPTMWKFCMAGRGTGLSPGQLSKELNQTIESWLRDYCQRLQQGTRAPRILVTDSIGLLTVVGFKKTDAGEVCNELIREIQDPLLKHRNPFDNNGRAKYCYPVTQKMIENKLKQWLAV